MKVLVAYSYSVKSRIQDFLQKNFVGGEHVRAAP